MKTLKVAHGILRADAVNNNGIKDYRVISVRNSVRYAPGQILEKAEVADLCEDASWDIIVLPLDGEKK